MREETLKIYKFDELTEDVQEKVIDNNRDWNVDHSDWYEFVIENWKERLACIGFEGAKIEFTGFCSQGDGASFTSSVDVPKIVDALSCNDYTRDRFTLETMLHNDLIDLDISIERNGHHYSHELTCGVSLHWDYYSSSFAFEDWAGPACEQLESDIEDLRYSLCKQMYKELESEHEYQTSNESIKESIECNEIEFTEDGTIY